MPSLLPPVTIETLKRLDEVEKRCPHAFRHEDQDLYLAVTERSTGSANPVVAALAANKAWTALFAECIRNGLTLGKVPEAILDRVSAELLKDPHWESTLHARLTKGPHKVFAEFCTSFCAPLPLPNRDIGMHYMLLMFRVFELRLVPAPVPAPEPELVG